MGLVPYLADMIDMLLPKLVDSRPLVRSITCWGLSRYSHWIVERGLDPGTPGQVQLDTVMKVRNAPAQQNIFTEPDMWWQHEVLTTNRKNRNTRFETAMLSSGLRARRNVLN